MPKVVGIGGVFFRAADPAGLAEWYESILESTTCTSRYDSKRQGQQFSGRSPRIPTILDEQNSSG